MRLEMTSKTDQPSDGQRKLISPRADSVDSDQLAQTDRLL